MPLISVKSWAGVADNTAAQSAPGETGSALTRAAFSEETAPGTSVVLSGSIVPTQATGGTGAWIDPTARGSADYTQRIRMYFGDHGNGVAGIFVRQASQARYEALWVQTAGRIYLRRYNTSNVETNLTADVSGSGLHDHVVDMYFRVSGSSSTLLEVWFRRASDGFYWNPATPGWQSGAVNIFTYTDSTSPLVAAGTSGWTFRLAGSGAVRQRVEEMDLDGTAATTDPVITGPSGAAGAATSTANIAENAATGPTFTTDISLGGGYPTLTGAQAANWTITALSSTSWRLDPVTPFNFESGSLVNPQAVTFNASATVSQACSITVTNVNESPSFSGTITVPTLAQGVAMTPIALAGRWSDPEGATLTYAQAGTWPPGVSVSGGNIQGTPTAIGTYSGLTVTASDGTNPAVASNTFSIQVVAVVTFSGPVPAQSGAVGSAFSLNLASYFAGTLTPFSYSVVAGSLPPGLTLASGTGVVSGTPTTAGTYNATVRATDTGSNTATTNSITFTISASGTSVSFSGTIPAQSGTVGTPVSLGVASYFTGSFTPFSYSVFSGSLPPGLTLNASTGVISGSPTTAGSYSVTIRATDSGSNTANSNTVAFTVSAPGAATITTEPFNNWSGAGATSPMASQAVPVVSVLTMAGVSVLQLTNQATDGSGSLAINNAALTAGVDYMVACWNEDGTIRGLKKYRAL